MPCLSSPVLANIYLNQRDHFVETHLIPKHTRGQVRKKNPAYRRIQERLSRARRKGEYRKAKALLRQAQQLPAGDPNAPTYAKMIKRYRAITQTPHGPRKCFQACLERTNGKKPLRAQFGGIPLIHRKEAVLIDRVPASTRSEKKEVVRRLLAGRCELCESRDEHCVVHQTRKLAVLEKMGKERPRWAHIMLKRRRKTLIVCQTCHHDIHEGWKGNRIS